MQLYVRLAASRFPEMDAAIPQIIADELQMLVALGIT